MNRHRALRLSTAALLAVLLVSQSGCATCLRNFILPGLHGGPEPRVYGGVMVYVENWSDPKREYWWQHILAALFTLIDFPLCLVADTLTLPITVPLELSREAESEPKPEPESP